MSFSNFSANPNLKIIDILNNPKEHWNLFMISRNKFLYDDIVFNREIKKGIEKRRKATKDLKLYGHLH